MLQHAHALKGVRQTTRYIPFRVYAQQRPLRLPKKQKYDMNAISAPTRGTPAPSESSTWRSPDYTVTSFNVPDGLLRLKFERGAITVSSDQLGVDNCVVLDALSPMVTASQELSRNGALVLGVQSASGAQALLDVVVGQLKATRMLVCARNKLWWMTPEWRTSTRDIPSETQFLLAELREGGPYALLLPLIDGDFRSTLRYVKNTRNNDLCLRVESGAKHVAASQWGAVMHVSAGNDPYKLIDEGVIAAAALSGGAQPRVAKPLPPSLDVFGWCTWDAFYSTVSASGIQTGLASLRDGGVNPGFLIIDDGWQLTDVDPPYRKAPTVDMATNMKLPAEVSSELEQAEGDYYASSEKVISEAASMLPAGTPAGVATRNLAGVGPTPHHPVEMHPPTPLPKEQSSTTAVRTYQAVTGWLAGLGAAAFLLMYQWVVDPAPPGSLRVKLFARAASGALKPAMLSFFATASDFTRRITSVKANAKFSSPDAGPEEDWEGKEERLGDVVNAIKEKFGIQYVYCWHGLPLYWSGVMPGAPALAHHNARVVMATPTPGVEEVEPSLAWNPAVLAGVGVVDEPQALYNELHSYLRSSGVDGVKVDCQAGVGLVGSAFDGGPALSQKFHRALEKSIRENFQDNHAINCMCHSTENLYRMSHTAVARASDDYYPRDPASSHPHIAACALNSLFLSPLVQPDWDMFQSKHSAARLHAMARAVSGGGVYVSDKPGEHDFALLRELVLPDGGVLRAALPARPTRDCLFVDVLRDKKTLLKVWTRNAVTGVVGVFHLQGSAWDRIRRKFLIHDSAPPALTTRVRPADVEIFREGGAGVEYACYSYEKKVLKVLEIGDSVEVALATGHSDIVTISPVIITGGVSFAPLGLRNMMNGGGAALSCQPSTSTLPGSSANITENPGVSFTMRVRGYGEFAMYSSRRPAGIMYEGREVGCEFDGESGMLVADIPCTDALLGDLTVKYA